MPSGGYREKGAFKKGNLCALKHGKYSPRLRELLDEFPEGFFMLDKKTGVVFFQRKNQ